MVLLCDNTTAAIVEARRNWQQNTAAARRRSCSAPSDFPSAVEFVYGRDGTLTTRCNNCWHRGCSVPTAAARTQFRAVNVASPAVCLLDPAHAATVQALLDRLNPSQAVLAVVPNVSDFAILWACGNLAEIIDSGRLWFAWGDNWQPQLLEILSREEGLAIPSQFIRTPHMDGGIQDSLVDAAQKVFSAVASVRKKCLEELTTSDPGDALTTDVLVVASRQFRLWADSGEWLLRAIAGELAYRCFDTDSPLAASHLSLARAAQGCRAILAADLFRADAGTQLARSAPWITWVTRQQIPPFSTAANGDGLIVPDESLVTVAQQMGWPLERIRLGSVETHGSPQGALTGIAILCDLPDLQPSAEMESLSSMRLLWEHLLARLFSSPFDAFDRSESLVLESIDSLQLDREKIAIARFTDQLIPAGYAAGIVRILRKHGINFDIYGDGWDQVPDASANFRGMIRSRLDFERAVEASRLLVHVWPSSRWHPIDSCGRPVVKGTRRGVDAFISQFKANRSPVPTPPLPTVLNAFRELTRWTCSIANPA